MKGADIIRPPIQGRPPGCFRNSSVKTLVVGHLISIKKCSWIQVVVTVHAHLLIAPVKSALSYRSRGAAATGAYCIGSGVVSAPLVADG
jgi:hypothetical protein